jgi:DNA-binding winged helix-turn-helix (wHTH) protein
MVYIVSNNALTVRALDLGMKKLERAVREEGDEKFIETVRRIGC